jgi:ABC-type sugar transport system ATPase subunit
MRIRHYRTRAADAAAGDGTRPAMTMGRAEPPPLLELRSIYKRFGGVQALRGASFVIGDGGSVAGLLGQNGSGKSTLLGVLSGQLLPDSGSLLLDGEPVHFAGPPAAVAAGIAMVSQETAVAPDLSITENILLGRLVRRRGRVDWRASRAQAESVLARLGLDYDPRALVSSLRPDQRQMIEIARALSIDARILVLDEPTSSLTQNEAQSLFTVIRQLAAHQVATIFVSHRLAEMFAVASELTILRDGQAVSSGAIGEFDAARVVRDMTGEASGTAQGPSPAQPAGVPQPARLHPAATAAPVLACESVVAAPQVDGVDLHVRPGEIVGIAGLVGAGRSELLRVLFGLRPYDSGVVWIGGDRVTWATPREAIAHGVGYLPPDRKSQGLVLSMSVTDNLTVIDTLAARRWKPPRRALARESMDYARGSLHLRAGSGDSLVGTLSGGNQQKVALAKWLRNKPRLLLLDEPTRGVDVAAKGEIHRLLRQAAGEGAGLLVSSSENDELLAICDRIAVMFRGTVVATVAAAQATEATLAQLAGGDA